MSNKLKEVEVEIKVIDIRGILSPKNELLNTIV